MLYSVFCIASGNIDIIFLFIMIFFKIVYCSALKRVHCEEAPETFIHLTTECPRLEQQRKDIFLDKVPDGSLNWNIGKIKKFILTTAVYDMLTKKDHYNALTIIQIDHNYLSSAES